MEPPLPIVPFDYPVFRFNQMKLEGFNVRRWASNWFDGINQIRDWILEVNLAGFSFLAVKLIDRFDSYRERSRFVSP